MGYMEVFEKFFQELGRRVRVEPGESLAMESAMPCCDLLGPLRRVGREEWQHLCGAIFCARTLTVIRPATPTPCRPSIRGSSSNRGASK